MKIIKRIFLVLFVLLILLVGAAFAIPYFFKDEIVAAVKKEINNNINAKADFSDVSLSLFRSFPDFSVRLNDLEVSGIEKFNGVKLLGTESFDLTLDLMSVIKSDRPIELQSIAINEPEVNIVILNDGTANYDIVKPSATNEPTEAAESGSFLVKLKSYTIENGKLTYDDRKGDIFVKINDLNHSGSGDFTEDIYDLVTKTNIGGLTAKSGGISYLKNAKTDADVTVTADMKNMKFTLKDNIIKINALKINTDGYVAMPSDDIKMDLKFNAPTTDFKHILSLVPSAYTSDFEGVKASGDATIGGFVKGVYNDKNLPAFAVDVDVKNGNFQYPDLPLGVTGINTKVNVNSPSSDFDKMTIDIPQFDLNIGNNPIKGRFNLRTPISDPDIDTKVNGVLDLEELSRAFPLEGVEEMKGIIIADVEAKTKMSYLDNAQYDKADMSGNMKVRNMDYVAEGMPHVLIKDMQMDFTPQHVKVDQFDAKMGKSDIRASGTIDNILAYFSPDKTMKGNLKVRSNLFDANEWMAEEETRTTTDNTDIEAVDQAVFDRFDFTVDSDFNKIIYDTYTLENTNLKGHMTPSKAVIDNFASKIGKSDIQAKGKIQNIFGYVFGNETLTGKLDLVSDLLELNELMGFVPAEEATTTTSTSASSEPYLIPENVHVDIQANIKELVYTNLDLKNMKGHVAIKDEMIAMENVKANTLGGAFTLNGGYNSQDHNKPIFDIDYAIDKFKFQEAFQKLNTFEKLAPIGKFIDGVFNSKFKISGEMGKDMMPDINTINVDGFINTLNGVIQNFKPVAKLGGALSNQIDAKYLSEKIPIKDTKNWLKVKNGIVEVSPFDFKFKDIEMNIGGKHGLDMDMDYNFKLKIPRKLFNKGTAGTAANKGIEWLNNEAAKLGLNVEVGEFVNVLVNLTGSIKNPKTKLKLLGTEGKSLNETVETKAKELVEHAIDSVKTRVNEEVDKVKEQANEIVDKTVDSVETRVQEEVDKVVDQVTDKVEDKVEEVVKDKVEEVVKDQVGDKVKDVVGDKAGEVGDKVKDALGGWNPFKKKKKEQPKEEGGN